MKKSIILLTSLFAVLGLASCGLTSVSSVSSVADDGTDILLQGNDAYAYEAVSALSMVPAALGTSDSSTLSLRLKSGSGSSAADSETDAALLSTVETYLPIIDTSLTNADTLTYADATSDNQDYANLMTVSYLNIDGSQKTLDLYYNVISDGTDETGADSTSQTSASSSAAETSSDSAAGTSSATSQNTYQYHYGDKNLGYTHMFQDGNDDTDADEDYTAVVSEINGIVVADGDQYPMAGRTVVSSAGNLAVDIGFYTDPTSYIKVRQVFADNAQMFRYTVFSEGKVTYSYALGLMTSDAKTMVSLKEKSIDGNLALRFSFFDYSSRNLIRVTIRNGKGGTEIYYFEKTVDETTGEASFSQISIR